MLTFLRILASKSLWLILSFFIIVAVLAVTNNLPGRLQEWRSQANNSAATAREIQGGVPQFRADAREALRAADREIAALQQASEEGLVQAERDLARRRQEAAERVLSEAEIASAVLMGRTELLAASFRTQYVDLPLLDRASRLIQVRKDNLEIASIDRSLAQHRLAVARYNARVRQRDRLRQEARDQSRNPVCARAVWLPGCDLARELRERNIALRDERRRLEDDARLLRFRQDSQRELVRRREQVEDGAAIVARATQAYTAEAQRLSTQAGNYAWNQAKDALRRYSGTALWILLGAVLVPILFKLFAFHVVAPMAARSRPIRLRHGGTPLTATASDMSVEVPIDPGSELLLRSGLQSSSTDIGGADRYVLDWQMPFTCLAAGLVNLQRLRSDRPDHVVVTGTDEHHRVAIIDIPADGAMVFQPRALLGVVKPRDVSLRVTRPWRLGHLISWITMQLRYVVFHGPCTLIVQGHDGLQVENASWGRMINKRLTLGFDAGLAYGAARTPSFLPYLHGQASLFNDRFEGIGRYLYEQRAGVAGTSSIWGRGLKGIGDGVLKVFGV